MFNKGILTALLIGSTLPVAGCITVVEEGYGQPGGMRRGPPPPPQRVWVDPQGGGSCPHPLANMGTAVGHYCESLYRDFPPPHYGRPPTRRY